MQATLERLRARREEMGDEGGFTLIELLIVIVILGILAAIVVFAVQNLTGQSATAACQGNYKTVETALEAFKAQTGSYPADSNTTHTTPAAESPAIFSALETTATGQDGATDGPWLRDTPPTAGTTGPYAVLVDNSGNLYVQTFQANGAKTSGTGAANTNTQCSQA